MTSRVSWSVEGIEPSVREKAEAAARKAGLSLSDWMKAAAGGASPDVREARDVAEIHSRLDAIARQVEQMAGPNTAARSDPAVARQLNDAINRLDARLSQISSRQAPARAEQPAYPLPPPDFSIAEIVARQGELDGRPQRQSPLQMPYAPQPAPYLPPQMTAPIAPAYPDLSGMEKQLFNISGQIDALRRPDGLEQSIAAFRTELSEIRAAITEAMPRRAIESLESEIRSLAQRIDETRQHGFDSNALSGIERALADIKNELRSLTPAEQLAGFDEAIRNLGGKIDKIVRSGQDSGAVHQLDEAIAALKTIVANIASGDVMAQLADNVRALSQKVDQLSQAGGHSDILAALEQRIGVLTSALEQRERPAPADSSYFDNAVRTISDRLDHLKVGSDPSSTFAHVEQRVSHLLERLEAIESRPANFGRIEDGLAEIMRVLQQRTESSIQPSAAPMDQGFIDAMKRELADMRYSQSEIDRQTQDSLEVVNNTLGHVVDRLAHIEGDLREGRATPRPTVPPVITSAPLAPAHAEPPHPAAASTAASMPLQHRPELPNPALAQIHVRTTPPQIQTEVPSPRAAAEVSRDSSSTPAVPRPRTARMPIDPDLPPDHPLEPGTRHPQGRAISSAERIAASEGALKDIVANTPEPVSSSNFIQAARRAAQAAQNANASAGSTAPKANRVTALNDTARIASRTSSKTSSDPAASQLSTRIRAILVGVSVVVIVFGTVKMAMNLMRSGDPSMPAPAAETRVIPQVPDMPPAEQPAPPEPKTENVAPSEPSMTSPTPIDKQSSLSGPSLPSWSSSASAMTGDITGSVSSSSAAALTPKTAGKKAAAVNAPVLAQLPDAIGSATLRGAALKGDPGAAYEIGLRYAEGRGVPVNFDEAAKWYGRAAQGNIVPAIFRLGTLYEKGLGVAKDADMASRYYRQAADRGNAKAMHNLAVLEADGGGKSPDYKSAAEWFHKAAERGVADSQFNLAILYARGIGVQQNLAESYKWFSLAAAQGDVDSGRKRDDIAKRLDAQSLAAAKLAIQTFTVEQQPADAVSVAAPAGGWDAATPAPQKRIIKSAKPAASGAPSSRASTPTKTAAVVNPS
ncbi:MAG: hypothetical protein EKK40_07660 [Bradyrhizobiaceae bacterium]|nr:MAG: hypothetical protein EKK40_07660 [Bradyrhizobiaceae bacterium]